MIRAVLTDRWTGSGFDLAWFSSPSFERLVGNTLSTTHIPEISTENPIQKIGTINLHENRAFPIH